MILLAISLVAVSSALFYLASPHQRWRVHPLRAPVARAAGAAGFAFALATFIHATSPLAGLFMFVTAAMLFLVVPPYLGALARPSKRS